MVVLQRPHAHAATIVVVEAHPDLARVEALIGHPLLLGGGDGCACSCLLEWPNKAESASRSWTVVGTSRTSTDWRSTTGHAHLGITMRRAE